MNEYTAFLATLSSDEKEELAERAAIMEFDGGLSRSEAERLAMMFFNEKSEVVEWMEEK